MRIRQTVLLAASLGLAQCGGSSSETPWPVEPLDAVRGPQGELLLGREASAVRAAQPMRTNAEIEEQEALGTDEGKAREKKRAATPDGEEAGTHQEQDRAKVKGRAAGPGKAKPEDLEPPEEEAAPVDDDDAADAGAPRGSADEDADKAAAKRRESERRRRRHLPASP